MESKKKKILYVHHAGGFGGAPKSMSYIIKYLNYEKYDALLINIENGPINEFFRQELKCPLFIEKRIRPFHGSTVVENDFRLFLRNWIFLIPSIYFAYRSIKIQAPDIIHLNSSCLFSFAIAAFFVGRSDVVCHVREPIRKGWSGFPLRFFNKIFATKFIAISNYDLCSLGKISHKKMHRVIYNFVEKFYIKNEIESDLRKELGLPMNSIVFLYLARFAKSNGWEELVQMASKVLQDKDNNQLYFILVGATKENDYLQGLHPNIRILPFQNDIELFLKCSDVFICPFVEPHFARGVIEASAFSLPIIGSDIGGVNELIINGETGYLYNSEIEFMRCVLDMASNKEMRKLMGYNAYQFAKECFNIELNLKETYSFYE